MTVHPAVSDAVPVPDPMAKAVGLLVARALSLPYGGDVDKAMAALFGGTAPTFGQVRRISAKDLKDALDRAGLGAAPAAAVRELSELLPRVAPDVPVCASCGEFPLSDIGGKIATLDHGAACPFCDHGVLQRVPVTLRKIAWTDGRLVEPQTEHDLRAKAGARIPLTDPLIKEWIGGWMHLGLERALADAGVPLYAFLAYMNLVRKALRFPRDAATLLQEPDEFGLPDAAAITDAVREAAALRGEREVTNEPARTSFRFLRGDPDAFPRAEVAGRAYLVEGRVGTGDACDVFRGAWDHPLTERVILKVGRDDGAAAGLRREAEMLSALRTSKANGTPFFVRMFPEIVATDHSADRPVTAFRYKNRFDWTLADVIREYPDGVDPQTMVWMWNRTLTLVGWLQMAGFTHGTLVPSHLLIHPVNHGVTFLGWTHAVRTGKPVHAPNEAHEPYFPAEVLRKEPATAETDVAMSARCMIAVLGGDPGTGSLPASVPAPIADVLRAHARYDDGAKRIADAFVLEKEFGRIAESVFGPRRYHPFVMPRPSR